jgi:RNA polymerase sigma-70 factor (ECF subfamily)
MEPGPERARLFSIAYRMLGSASDAEDVLQDAWLRYRAADPATIRSTQAFMTTIVTRLCLDRLKSARHTREEYVGSWLPEPVLTSELASPEATLERAESVTLAFLVLLETLSPEERAVLLLKEVCDYGHAEVADILGTTAENSRQLLHRAKARLAQARPPAASVSHAAASQSTRAVAERFARAFSTGDGSELTTLLAQDVGFWSDGGGRATAARRPLFGRDAVLKLLLGLHRTAHASEAIRDVSWTMDDVNSEPALVVRVNGRLESIFVFTVESEAIVAIRVMRNPDKLARIDRQLTTLH